MTIVYHDGVPTLYYGDTPFQIGDLDYLIRSLLVVNGQGERESFLRSVLENFSLVEVQPLLLEMLAREAPTSTPDRAKALITFLKSSLDKTIPILDRTIESLLVDEPSGLRTRILNGLMGYSAFDPEQLFPNRKVDEDWREEEGPFRGPWLNNELIYIGELVHASPWRLLKSKNFGRKCLRTLRGLLGQYDLDFGMYFPYWISPRGLTPIRANKSKGFSPSYTVCWLPPVKKEND